MLKSLTIFHDDDTSETVHFTTIQQKAVWLFEHGVITETEYKERI